MSFVFPARMANLRPLAVRNMSTTSSLPVISEDSDTFDTDPNAPPIPPRALSRPAAKMQAFGDAPRPYYSKNSYKDLDSMGIIGPRGEKLADLRRGISRDIKNNKYVAKRGGWKRVTFVTAILVCIIVGVVVGVVAGVNKKNSSSGTSNQNTAGGASGTIPQPTTNSGESFPAGSYTFDTVLSTISTNCTSNPATWMCYPYATYSTNPTASEATFDWVISGSADTNYTISSTPNYFSIVFSNITLSLQDVGLATEHYYFGTITQKLTKPTSQLGNSNVASTCYFNQTIFQGFLYTKMNATYGASTNATAGADVSGYKPWPYAVKVEQVAGAAPGTPNCVGSDGSSLGAFAVVDTTQRCGCEYLNTGT